MGVTREGKKGRKEMYSDVVGFTGMPGEPRPSRSGYWRWPQRDRPGNAIDFFMRVLGLSFHQAMRQLTGL